MSKSDEQLKQFQQFRAKLTEALDAVNVGHDRNIFKSGHEIAWPYHDIAWRYDTEVDDRVHVQWFDTASVVFWPDADVERLIRLARDPERAVSVVLERRTQFEVEAFCAKLEQIERRLMETTAAMLKEGDDEVLRGSPTAVCDTCGRRSWLPVDIDRLQICGIKQPGGGPCPGALSNLLVRPATDDAR